jgi:hypothetical protein
MHIQLLSAATATNGKPSGATAGVSRKFRTSNSQDGIGEFTTLLNLVSSTAGSGTMTVTCRLWGYREFFNSLGVATGVWYPIGVTTDGATTGGSGTDANRGYLNRGVLIGETDSDIIAHAELVTGVGSFTRFYGEIVAIAGTATAINWYLTAEGVHA